MNGAFLLLFTTDQLGSGSVEVTLESDMTEKDAEIQHFSGRGSEKVKEQGYDCLIEDGMMKKTGRLRPIEPVLICFRRMAAKCYIFIWQKLHLLW